MQMNCFISDVSTFYPWCDSDKQTIISYMLFLCIPVMFYRVIEHFIVAFNNFTEEDRVPG